MTGRLERWLTARPLVVTLPLLLAGLAVLGGAIAAGFSYVQYSLQIRERSENYLATRLISAQGTIELMLQSELASEVQQKVVDLYTDPSIVLAVAADEHLRTFAAGRQQWIGRPVPELMVEQGFDPDTVTGTLASVRSRLNGKITLTPDGNFMVGIYPLTFRGKGKGLFEDPVGVLVGVRDLRHDRYETIVSVLANTQLQTGLILVLALGIGLFGHLVISRRLNRVIAATKSLAAGHADARVQMPGNDELSEIGNAIDAMASQLERQKQILALSLDQTHLVLATALDGVIGMDSDGLITLWNPRAAFIFGWSAEEAVGRNMAELIIPPRYRAAHRSGLKRFLDTGQSSMLGRRIEIEAVRRSGEIFPVELSVSLLQTASGVRFSAFLRDITEHKAAAAALAAANRKYQVLVENLQEGILVVRDEKILYANTAMHRMLGYENGELTGMPAYEIVPVEEREIGRDRARRRLAGEAVPNFREGIMLKKGGKDKIYTDQRITLTDFDGQLAFVGAVTDVTERKAAAAAAAAATRKYQVLVENVQEGILVVRDLEILFANPAMHAMLGYDNGELNGRHVFDILPEEDYASSHEINKLRFSGGALPVRNEWTLLKKGRREQIYVDQRITLAEFDGETVFLGAVTDITGRRKAQAAIDAANRRYQAVVENMQEGILVVRECVILYANRAMHDLLEFDMGELCGASLLQILRPEEHEIAREKDAIRLAGKPVNARREGVLLKKGGHDQIFIDQRITLTEYDGEPAILAAVTDITERKKAEATIAAINRRYQALVEHINEGVILARDEHILYANPAMHSMLGYEPGEMIDRPFSIVFPAEDWESTRQRGRRRIAGENEPTEYETVMVTKGGARRVIVQVRVSVIDLDGRPALLGAATDITEAKRAQWALKEANEKYRLLVENPKDGMFISKGLKFVYANPAMHHLLGYGPGELIGMNPRDIVAPEDYPGVEARAALRRTGKLESSEEEIRMRRKDGAEVVVDSYVTIATYEGEQAVLGVLHDITARKQAEAQRDLLQRQLLQAQKMEAIGQLTGGIAHDFNNVLMSIRGHNSLALAAASEGRFEDACDDLQEVQASVDRAADLVANLLAFARVRKGDATRLELAPALKNSMRMLRAALPTTIEMDLSAIPDIPPVSMEPVQLQQVLLNLCINARDAQSGKGQIRLRVDFARGESGVCQSCAQPYSGDYVLLSVSDQGSGIDPQVLARIFEPFFTTKEVGHGSGMGLAMVHGVVHEHGGHLRVTANRPHGTTFTLLLPPAVVTHAPVPVATPQEAPETIAQSARIMLVDDEPTICRFLTRLLRSRGYTVNTFGNPIEAREFIDHNGKDVDLLFTDKTMPGMNGLELARYCLGRRPDLAVILVTGYGEQAEEEEALRIGIRTVLQKPIASEKILAAVSAALEGKAQRPGAGTR